VNDLCSWNFYEIDFGSHRLSTRRDADGKDAACDYELYLHDSLPKVNIEPAPALQTDKHMFAFW